MLSHDSSSGGRSLYPLLDKGVCDRILLMGLKLRNSTSPRVMMAPGSAACPPSSQSPSNSTCIRRSQEIAHRALLTYSQAHGSVSETPSVESIMSAYKQDGNGDRDLLIAILDAKKVEDEVGNTTSLPFRIVLDLTHRD